MSRFALFAALLALSLAPAPVRAQEADTTARDTAVVPVDTARAAADSLQAPADTLAADTTTAGPTAASLQARRARARRAARAAAEEWLSLIDAGKFDESWDAADSTLQARLSREDWIDQGIRAQARLDTLRARTLTQTQYRDSTNRLPGGRPVVVLQYESEYAKGRALEAVITTKRDTAWKVAGYRVVSAPDSVQAPSDTTQPSSP